MRFTVLHKRLDVDLTEAEEELVDTRKLLHAETDGTSVWLLFYVPTPEPEEEQS